MRIGVLSTRLSGTDGVSLEVEKWARVLEERGHEMVYCAGELGGYARYGTLIPLLHFEHPEIAEITNRAFFHPAEADLADLSSQIDALAGRISGDLRNFILAEGIDLLLIQNALSIPMNLPLGVSLAKLIEDLALKTIAHHHDFYWERQRFQSSPVLDLLDTVFPPASPLIQHVTINSIAQNRLRARRGIDSLVVPNVFDFEHPPAGVDAFNRDFRSALGLGAGDLYFLQPTRVIQRKGIELAMELVRRLGLPNVHLIVTHKASDEGLGYWRWLQHEARMMEVELRLVEELIGTERSEENGKKIYALWDAYPTADLVMYTSVYEGFGNALLEAIFFKRPVVINRYPVYNADIGPLGFEFIELDGFVSAAAVNQVHELLEDPPRIQEMAEHNYDIASRHFSMKTLRTKIDRLLRDV